ncbi:MAG: hypothetical protein R3C70_14765 [Geminicoccaceae bacterium]
MMTRRHIIRTLMIGLASAPGILAALPAARADGVRSTRIDRLRALLLQPQHARAIGTAALRKSPADPASLVHALVKRHPPLAGNAPLARRRAMLETIIAEDFATGRTTLVDGWLLSRSETELFMLEALH